MGCVYSRVEKEETVQRCRDRKKLMKQLMSCRVDLAAAHMAYLRSLRNTGATLRQFTEVESLIPGNPPPGLALPPSPPPPPLFPSPPPPPYFGPEVREVTLEAELSEEDVVDVDDDDDDDDDDSCKPPPPPGNSSKWEFWDPFGPPSSDSSSPVPREGGAEENWAETNTEFREEDEEEAKEGVGKGEGKELAGGENVLLDVVKEKSLGRELVDDNSSAMSLMTRDTDMAVVVWRSKKTLAGIVKEIDDYFLKAAAGGSDVVVLLESNRGQRLQWSSEEINRKRSKSAKVFNALSWSWSFRSPQSSGDTCGQEASDARRPNHGTTLEKLHAEEQRLYKEVKEEELLKFLHKKKTLLLHRLEARDHDHTKLEEVRLSIENLQSRILSLQESINGTCLSISKLRDEELHPQLVELTFGLVQMWRAMYECHQVQSHIAQQANLLDSHPGTEPTTESHRFATAQLETEVTSWYTSFCNLLRSHSEYVHVLNQWVRLTDCLPDTLDLTGSSSGIHALCEEWQLALDRLPYKVAAEAIKSFVSVIHSIVLQQNEERKLQKKSHRLESRLEKELTSLSNMEGRHEENTVGSHARFSSPNHHLSSIKHGKLESLKKRMEEEKAKYLNSVRISRAMTLNNLQTGLPNIFQAMMGFAGICVQAFEGIRRPTGATETTEHRGSFSPLSPLTQYSELDVLA